MLKSNRNQRGFWPDPTIACLVALTIAGRYKPIQYQVLSELIDRIDRIDRMDRLRSREKSP